MSIEIIITPSVRPRHHYDAHHGETLLCTSRIPFFDGARVLLSKGYDPSTPLNLRHQGSAHVSLWSTIGQAAELTVVENARRGPVFEPYEPYPLKESRKAEKLSAVRINSEHQGSVTSGKEAILGA